MKNIINIVLLILFYNTIQSQPVFKTLDTTTKTIKSSNNINVLFYCTPLSDFSDLGEATSHHFNLSTIVTTSGSTFRLPLFYDIKNDNVYISTNNQICKLIPEKISTIKQNNKTFVFSSYEIDHHIYKNYMELMMNGEICLLKLNKNNHSKTKQKYFIKSSQQPAQAIKLKAKILYPLFKDKIPFIQRHIKKNNLDISKEKDLIKVINYYNSVLIQKTLSTSNFSSNDF